MVSLNRFFWRLFGVLLLPGLIAGVAAGAGTRSPEEGPPSSGGRGKPVALGENSFTLVTLTNEIQPEWLRPPTNLFRLGPGDTIEIENLGHPEARSGAVVGPDGKIYYTLLPGLPVWGLTLTESKELLEKELNRYTRVKPELSVSLRNVGSKRIWILGTVQAPGVYPLATPLTLLEALSLAGGATPVGGSLTGMADLKTSFVMRNGQPLGIDFHRLLGLGDLSQNIYLQPDDFVFIRSSVARNIYVLGAVAAPNVIAYSDRLTLLGALASAGGTVEYSRVGQVAIVRGSLNSPRIALVDYKAIYLGKAPDVRLEPGDIVYVPFVAYRKLALLAENLIQTLVTTLAANEGSRAAGGNAIGVSAPVNR